MIRQELGRAELRHVENDQMIQTANLVELLSDTIIGTAPLNVNSQPFDVHGMVEKCVNLAVLKYTYPL